MKRTKQAYFRPNPSFNETNNLSGVTFVFGQDNNYHQRTKQYQELQKQFLDEQIQQKQALKQAQNQKNKNNDDDLLQVNRYRGKLQSEKNQRLVNMNRACDDYNLQLLEERKLKEKLEKQRELQEQRRQIELLNQRNVKRYIPGKQP